jgi:hypothetical protein
MNATDATDMVLQIGNRHISRGRTLHNIRVLVHTLLLFVAVAESANLQVGSVAPELAR